MKRAKYSVGDNVILLAYAGSYNDGEGSLGKVIDIQYVVVRGVDGLERVTNIRYIVEIADDNSDFNGECVVAYDGTMVRDDD